MLGRGLSRLVAVPGCLQGRAIKGKLPGRIFGRGRINDHGGPGEAGGALLTNFPAG